MPLDIQIPYRGDQYLFQGISGGAAGAAAGIDHAIKRHKQVQDAGKAADYFMKAGGDEMYQALGIHPEQWKTLGSMDKMQAVEGLLKARAVKEHEEQTAAMTEERRARAAQLKFSTEEREAEAGAFPEFMRRLMELQGTSTGTNAPTDPQASGMITETGGMPEQASEAAAIMRSKPDGAMFSPENLVKAASGMGQTNPRMAAVMMRQIMPQLIGNTETPRPWMSPEGNPYVTYHHTMMPDKEQFDPSTLMGAGNMPEGYTGVVTGPNHMQVVKTSKELPASFHSTLDTIGTDIASAQATLAQPETAFRNADDAKTMKGYAQRRLEGAQKRGKQTIERYHTAGYTSDEERADFYEQLGLPAPAAAKKKAAAKPGTDDGKVTVEKGGQQFKLPKAQLQDAIKQGYTEVTK